jgi:hypothetical protein
VVGCRHSHIRYSKPGSSTIGIGSGEAGATAPTTILASVGIGAGDGFSKKDATFAVNYIDVNWNKQAAKAAKNYLEIQSFSRQGLISSWSRRVATASPPLRPSTGEQDRSLMTKPGDRDYFPITRAQAGA